MSDVVVVTPQGTRRRQLTDDEITQREKDAANALAQEQAEAERAAEPTVDDVGRAILILAEGDDTVAKRISDKAAEVAQARSSS